jgi:hypothetical protein
MRMWVSHILLILIFNLTKIYDMKYYSYNKEVIIYGILTIKRN